MSILDNQKRRQRGFSLLELMTVVIIIGIIAALVVPRIASSSENAKQKSCYHNRSELNSAIERFGLSTGNFPTTLSDLDTLNYFPDGIPVCPVTGAIYTLNTTTNRVEAHTTANNH